MKVLLVNGSPHKKGCTNRALEEVSKTLTEEGIETTIFHIGTKPIAGCMACGQCKSKGQCVFDDQVNAFANICDDYDGYIFGSPVYYASMNGSMVGFMDRLFYSHASAFALKPAASVVSARRGGTTATFDQMNKYFTIAQMPIIASTYWNNVHGNSAEEVEQDLEGLQVMRNLGRNMAFFLKCKEAGLKAGVKEPVAQKDHYTNFIR